MEFKKDLLKKDKKSILKLVLGILFLVISGAWIVDRILEYQSFRLFDWFYSGILTLNGIVYTIEGSGLSISKLFGKAFVWIDNDRISIKPGIMDKEQKVYWNAIKTMDYKLNKYHIRQMDNTSITLDLSKLGYALKNEIRETLDSIAKKKNIQSVN